MWKTHDLVRVQGTASIVCKWARSHSTDRKNNDRALRPRTYPNANPKFCLVKHCGHPIRHALRRLHVENARFSASPGTASMVCKWARSHSTDRKNNDRALRPRTHPNANPKCCLDKAWGPPLRREFARLWGTFCYLTHPHLRNPAYLFDGAGLGFGWLRFGSL